MEPIEIIIQGREYYFYRPLKGSYTNKFNRMVKIAKDFDHIERKLTRMAERGNGCSKTARLAIATLMLMNTGIRVGNESSSEGYVTTPHPNSKAEPIFTQTYGLTTLLKDHVSIQGDKMTFFFTGKKSVDNYFEISGTLSDFVKNLYQSTEHGTLFDVTAYELTKFIKKYVGRFSPKDFRTLRANMVASIIVDEILERPLPKTKREFRAEIKEIATEVSKNLNNTPGVCKANYIDPHIWEDLTLNRLNV